MGDDVSMGPLQEATLDEIVEELSRRFDFLIVAGCSRLSKSNESTWFQWRGSSNAALGLAERARHRLHVHLDKPDRVEEE